MFIVNGVSGSSLHCINFGAATDGACGTGGMLTVAEGRMQEVAKEFGKNVSIHLYGQENSDETYAIARSDMLVKGEGVQANNIFLAPPFPMMDSLEKPLTLCFPTRLSAHLGKQI